MSLLRPSMLVTLCLLAAAPRLIASANDVRSFRVQANGTGRPMLLIPGLASSGDTWTTTVLHLGNRCTCHVLTLAGFAGTPPNNGPLFTTVVSDLADYIRRQHLDRPVVLGHSLGGMLAMALAADHPDLVGPLIVVDALPFLAGPNMQVENVEQARPAIASMEAYMSRMTQEQWDAYAKSGASTRYMVTAARDAETLIKWSVATDRQTLIRALAEAYSVDLREDVARITAPVLTLATWRGWHDQLAANKIDVPRSAFVQAFTEQFAKVPLLHFALHDTARHFIMWDDPEWFFNQIDAFLADPVAVTHERGLAAR